MVKKINPIRSLRGRLAVPPDKSLTHRAVLLSALSSGSSVIQNPLQAEDCLSSLECVKNLGCDVTPTPDTWTIQGRGLGQLQPPAGPLNCGNSGTTMRLLSGVLAAHEFECELTGDPSLSKRPMDRVANPLKEMGATFSLTEERYPPFKIKGSKALKPIQWSNPVASAQVKSCVLLAGLHVNGETQFTEPSLSRDHTERMLKALGVDITQNGTTTTLKGPAQLSARDWVIPGDFSSAAFFLVAGVLLEGSGLVLESVNLNPTRTGLLDVMKSMGAAIDIQTKESGGEPIGDLRPHGGLPLKGVKLDPSKSATLIDEFPILAVLATQADGPTEFEGLSELRIKETDRLAACAQNLQRMGADVQEKPDGLLINGPTPLNGAVVDSFGDHRIAMAFTIAGLVAEGETQLNDSDCVSISYASFWDHLKQVSVG